MTLLSSLVGIPRAPIFPYGGCGPGRGRSGTRPPTAVPNVNAIALVTPAVANRTFMTGKPSPAGCYRCLRSTGCECWAALPIPQVPSHQDRIEVGIPLYVGDLGDLLASEQYALSGGHWQGAAEAKIACRSEVFRPCGRLSAIAAELRHSPRRRVTDFMWKGR